MSKLLKKLNSRKGAIGMVALLIAMVAFAGTATYTLGGFSEGHEETTVGVGSTLNEIIPDPYVYVPVTHAAIPIIESHNVADTVILQDENVNLSMYATIRDNGELSYRWMHKQEGALNYTVAGEGAEYTYSPLPGVYYVYGEAINTNTNVNGEQIASAKTPEAKIIVLAKAQKASISTLPDFVTQFDNKAMTYSVNAIVTDEGTLTYKWFQVQNKNGATPVLVNSTNTLTVNNSNEGLYYYYAEITNTVNYEVFGRTHSETVKTPVMTVEIVQHSIAPQISNLQNIVLRSQEASEFSITASSLDGGTLSYNWYRNTVNSKTGATLVSSGLSNKIPVSFNAEAEGGLVKRFYYVDVTNTLNYIDTRGTTHTTTAIKSSNIGRLEVYPKALAPNIQVIPDQVITIGTATATATITTGDGGTISYKWYKIPSKENMVGTVVSTASSLSLTGLVTGPTFYYVEAVNSKPYIAEDGLSYANTATNKSNPFRIERIDEAVMPTISSLTDKVAVSGTTLNYMISASVSDAGVLTYKWYENTTNSYGGVVKSSTGSAFNYTPTIASGARTTYLYVEVTNTLDFKDSTGKVFRSAKTKRSNIVRLETFAPAQIPTINPITDQNVTTTTATITASASVTDGGALTYQWYKSSGNTNTAGTPLATSGNIANLTGLAIGPHYFYIDVTNSNPYTAVNGVVYPNMVSKKSPVVRIERIQLAQVPSVGILDNKVIESGQGITYLANGSVTDGGTLSYTWFTSTISTVVDEPIGTANKITVTPVATNETWSLRFYMVEVINTYTYVDATGHNHVSTASKKSNIATVEIYPFAEEPVHANLGDKVLRSGTAFTLNAGATVGDNGVLTYKWFKNTTNAYGGTQVGTAVNYSETISTTTTPVVSYYFVESTNTRIYKDKSGVDHTTVKTSRSNIARIQVYVAAQAPSIQVIPDQEISRIYATLTSTVSVTDGGTLSYQWYTNTVRTNVGGTAISGATTTTLDVNSLAIGAHYYYIEAVNSKPFLALDGVTYENKTTAKSNVVRIEIIAIAKEPIVGSIGDQIIESGKTLTYDIVASIIDDGILTYKWYESTTNSYAGNLVGATKVLSKTTTTGTTASVNFYYVEVVNTLNFVDSTGKIHTTTASKKSNIGKVETYPNAAYPTLDALADQEISVSNASISVNATVSDGGTISYKWFKTATKTTTGGTQVGTSKTLSYGGLTLGGHYFYVQVTNTRSYVAQNGQTFNAVTTSISNSARIEVIRIAQAPSVGTLANKVVISGTPVSFQAGATVPDDGVMTYKWFEHSSNTYAGVQMGTSEAYAVTKTTTTSPVIRYYFVEVVNTVNYTDSVGKVHTTTAMKRSNIARIETYAIAQTPIVTNIADQISTQLSAGITATATVTDSGTLSYQWYKTTGMTNNGGTPVGTNSKTLFLTELTVGGTYYYVQVTNDKPYSSIGGTVYPNSATSKSNAFRVEVILEALTPEMDAIPNSVIESGTNITFNANPRVTDTGILTYKWFESLTNAYAGTQVATTKTFTINMTTGSSATTKYYYLETTNTLNFIDSVGATHTSTAIAKSNISRVETYPMAVMPTVGNLVGDVISTGTAKTFDAVASVTDGGTLSYKWMENTVNAVGGTQKGTAASYSVTHSVTSPLTRFYYVEVSNSRVYTDLSGINHTSKVMKRSNIVSLEVYPDATVFGIEIMADQSHNGNLINTTIVPSVTGNNGTLTYKWFKPLTKVATGGTQVGTSATMTISGLTPGIHYYYVQITNTYSYTASNSQVYTNAETVMSNVVTIDVIRQAIQPTVGTLTNKVHLSGQTTTYGAGATSLDGGTLSYKWFESTTNAYAGTQVGTASTYVVNRTIASGNMVRYYYSEITNTTAHTDSKGVVHTTTSMLRTNIGRIETYAIAQAPVIPNIPSQNISGTGTIITNSATVTDGGTLTYAWFTATGPVTSGGAPAGTTTSLTVSDLPQGAHYYYLIVTNTKNFTDLSGIVHPNSATTTSNSVRIERIRTAGAPTVGTLANQVLQSGVGATFAAGATSPDGGVLSYKWFEHTSNSYAGTQVGTASSYTINKSVSAPTTIFVYVEVGNTFTYTDAVGATTPTTVTSRSNIARVEIYPNATIPVIGALGNSVVKSGIAVNFAPAVTGTNGTLSYEWYENTISATGGTLKASTSTYNAINTTASVLTRYYSLKVINTYSYTSVAGTVYTNTSQAWSNVARVEIYPVATAPVVGTLASSVVISGTAVSFAPSVTGNNGVLSYNWYENTVNATGGTQKSTSASYSVTHTITSPVTKYYSLLVTNTVSYTSVSGTVYTSTATAWTNVGRVEVYPVVTVPVVGVIANQMHNLNSVNLSLSTTVTGNNGTLSYKWFQPTSATTSGGTQVGTSATFTKSGVTPGIYFYYLEVVNTYTYTSASGTPYTQTASVKSNAVTIDVIKQAIAPAAFTLADKVHRSGQTTTYSTSASPDGGTLSYKWYENTTNVFGGTQVATTSTYVVNKTIASGSMVNYYSVELTNTVNHTDSLGVVHTTTAVRNSNVARVETYAIAQTPTVGTIAFQNIAGTTADIVASASVTDGGTLSYAWYKTTTAVTTGGTLQAGTGSILSVTGLTVGAHYYYVIVTNSKAFTSLSGTVYPNDTTKTSNSVRIERYYSAIAPTVGSLANQVLKSGTSATLSAGASTTDGGTLTYSWRESTTDAYAGTQVGTGSTFAVSKTTTTPITRFFYVEVTNNFNYTDAVGTVHTTTAMTRTNRSTVEVYPVATVPTITALANSVQRSGVGTTFAPTVTGHNGVLTYAWYENTSDATGGTSMSIASSYTATVNTSSPVTRYYSLLVTNTYTYTAIGGTTHTDIQTKWSNVARVEVYPAATIPTIGALSNRVVISATNVTYNASVTGNNGTLSYEWYENTANATGGTLKVATASYTFNLTTTTNIVRYYSVKVTNSVSYTAVDGTVHTHASAGWSNVARVESYAVAGVPTVSAIGNQAINAPGDTTVVGSATSPDSGTLSYKWFQTTSATTSGGTQVGTTATLTLTGLPVGRTFFYVEVTNSKPFTSLSGTVYANATSAKSNSMSVDVILQASNPTVGALTNRVVVSGTANAFSAGATSPDGGTLTYSWRESTTNAYSGTQVGTSATYSVTHNITSPLTRYYYVEVTNTVNYTDADSFVHTSAKMVRSNIARVEVYPAATTPTVGALANQVTRSGVAVSWATSVTGHNGTLSYNWYENTANATSGTAIGTASSQSRSHTTTAVLTKYISVLVTNTYTYTAVDGSLHSSTATKWSNVARLEVYPNATTPTIGALANQVARSGVAVSWTASVSGQNGALAYQWYENTSNATGGTALGGASSQSRSYTTSSPLTRYISLNVINTYSYTSVSGTVYTHTATAWSNVARFEVYPNATTPSVSITGGQATPVGGTLTYYSSVSGQNGSISYQWYYNGGNAVGGTGLGTNYYQSISQGSRSTLYLSVLVTNTYYYTSVSGTVYSHQAQAWSNVSYYDSYNIANTPSISGLGNQTTYDGYFWAGATVSGNGSISYAWNTGSTSSAISASGLAMGVYGYGVTVTNTVSDKGYTTSQTAYTSFSVTSKWLVTATDDGVGVILRSGPSTGYSSLGTYPAGTKITAVHSISGGWYHVTLANGAVGYIFQGTTAKGAYYLEEVTHASARLITTANVNMRNTASTGSVVVTVPGGVTTYYLRINTVVGSTTWYRILYVSGSSYYVGWTSGAYLRNP